MAERRLTVAIILRDRTNPANAVMETRRLTFSGRGDRATLNRGVTLFPKQPMRNAELVIGATVPGKNRGGDLALQTQIFYRKTFGGLRTDESVDVQAGIVFTLTEV
jgi:hypothetical protein